MNIAPKLSRQALVLLLSAPLFALGCDDPAIGKANAEVATAKAVDATKKADGAELAISSADSTIAFVGSKVTGSHDGGFKSFSGTATLAGDRIEGGSVVVEIDMGSVFTDSDMLTGHLKKADFFDIANHKTTKFVSTSIEKGGEGASHTVTGNLTLRGVTKSIKFPANISLKGEEASVRAELVIKRQQFGVAYAGKADDLIKDEVVIKLDLRLKKK